ncbi:hypothetical protein C8Q74DRAFT_1222632 [Fomes fomentarius]|nr:hypothetical protein C8Q74DRAFT_1222632 [Fomes fomentarius]
MSHPAPVLNYDVLGTVVEHAETKTLLSLMLCCRTLYEDGVRVLLAEPVRLDSENPKEDRIVWSFLEFMSADGGRRWQSLRGLLFGRARLFFRTAAQLAEGIKKSPNIEYLDLGYYEDGVLRYPELRAALATLENVKHITLSQVIKHGTYLFLESVRWPLVSATIYDCTLNYMEDNIPAKMHPAALLRCAQNTLIRVHWDYQLGPFNHPSGNTIYPNVKSLNMSNMTPTPHDWVKAYPNLSQLSVSMMRDRAGAGAGARERNMHALADQCWPRLETCHAHRVADLDALGLPCHIRAVKITQMMAWSDLPLFPETMEYARPVELELSSYGMDLTELRTFEKAANGLRDLEQLCLTLRFASESIDTDIPRSLSYMGNWGRYITFSYIHDTLHIK